MRQVLRALPVMTGLSEMTEQRVLKEYKEPVQAGMPVWKEPQELPGLLVLNVPLELSGLQVL